MRAILEQLPADVAPAFLWWGQSTARPWGHRDREGYVAEPDLANPAPGADLTLLTMTPQGASSHGLVGSSTTITVAETLPAGGLVGGILRLHYINFADSFTILRVGHAQVISNTTSSMVVTWLSQFAPNGYGVTMSNAGDLVNLTAHGLPVGTAVSFTGGTPPPEVVASTTYYVTNVAADTFQLSATLADAHAGTAIVFTADSSGTVTLAVGALHNLNGYVELQDLWKGYDSVQVLTPFQPELPGDYPAGAPVVPGYDLPAAMLDYERTALWRPFGWGEGLEGTGATGTSTATSATSMTKTGAGWTPHLFAGARVRCGAARGMVTDNTDDTLTVSSWVPSTPPASSAFEIHVPHWRDNRNHYDPGAGFRYPSNDMQPGAMSSVGKIYNRPAGIITASYVTPVLQVAPCSSVIQAAGYARVTAGAANGLLASAVGGKLRLQCNYTTSDPATGQIQLSSLLAPGYVVLVTGFTINSGTNINTYWRVSQVMPVAGGSGSYADFDPVAVAVGTVDATATAYTTVDRYINAPQHRFGGMVAFGWRMANMLGRPVHMIHLAINGSSIMLRHTPVLNGASFNGQIGWFADDNDCDWTPSRDDGLAARMRDLVAVMAPAALAVEGSKRLKVLGIVGFQGETESVSVTGRSIYYQLLSSWYAWLRDVVTGAGLSPYAADAKIPVVHAHITHTPWELVGLFYGVELTGDANGEVNAAIDKFAALDGFAATIDTEDSLKLDGTTPFGLDYGHYNGTGEALNAKLAADAMFGLLQFAYGFSAGATGQVAICNQALSLVGEPTAVTSLNPPDANRQAQLCATHFPEAKRVVLQRHTWTVASRRVSLALVDEPVSTWLYAYAVPADFLNVEAVLDPQAANDLQVGVLPQGTLDQFTLQQQLANASQPHKIETTMAGHRVLRTNQADAVLVYTSKNANVDDFDPLLRAALVQRLAYSLAGAVLKGKEGMAQQERFLRMSEAMLQQAAAANSQFQTDQHPQPRCSWLP